ncbi:MAG: hypothetical protein KDB07_01735, partial [Planctomycetes bacterium]|nr:hypothetical protein [Planctomycetota bacterium]
EIVCRALEALMQREHPARAAVLSRLAIDRRPAVVRVALPFALEHLSTEELFPLLNGVQQATNVELREIAAEGLAELRAKQNLNKAEAALQELSRAVDARSWSDVELYAAEVAKSIPRHPEVEFQLARAAALQGDHRRALVTLHHLLGLGKAWRERAQSEGDFACLHGNQAWASLFE